MVKTNEVQEDIITDAGIDSPLGIIRDEDRPMWNWILSDEAYLEKYHDALGEVTDVIGAGEIQTCI